MKPILKIYKKDVTSSWITILLPENQLSKEIIDFKIAKYIYLGYSVELI